MPQIFLSRPDATKVLSDCISAASKLIKAAEDGKSVQIGLGNLFELERLCFLISHELRIPEFEDEDLNKFHFVEKILRGLAHGKKFTWKAFRTAAADELESERNRPIVTFQVLIATNLDCHPFREPKKILPINTDLSKVAFKRLFELKPEVQKVILEDSDERHRSLVTSAWITHQSIQASTYQKAYAAAAESVGRLRSVINLHALFGSTSLMRGGSFPKPKTLFLPPPRYYVFSESWEKFHGEWLHLPKLDWKIERLKPEVLNPSRRFLSRHIRKAGPLVDVFDSACRMYTNALDNPETWAQFLGLWQLIELVSRGGSERMSDSEMRARLAIILGRNQALAELIDALHERRNRLVHAGKTGLIEEGDIRWTKLIAEQCIRFCLFNAGRLKTQEHIQAHFKLAGLAGAQLKAWGDVQKKMERDSRKAEKSREK